MKPLTRGLIGVYAHARSPVHRAFEAHLIQAHHVSRVIYGATIGLALVLALEDHPPASGVVAGTLVGTAIAVGLAELYSDVIGSEARRGTIGVNRVELRQMAGDVAGTSIGTAFPAVFFVLAAVGLLEPHTAFIVAKWSGLGLIGFYGFCAARLAGASLAVALLHAASVGVIGGILVALKSLLH